MSERDELYANARYLDDGGLAAELARVEHRLRYTWRAYARPEQIRPAEFSTWLITAGVGGGKLLCLDTPVATPSGWTTMGRLRDGDQVFDEAGVPCTVVAAHPVQLPERAYRVRFSDGTAIDAGGEHQWVTWDLQARKAFLRSNHVGDHTKFPEDWPTWRALTTEGMNSSTLGPEVIEAALKLHRGGLSARRIAKHLGVARQALARHLKAGRYVRTPPRVSETGPQIRTTDMLRATLHTGKRGLRNHSIPVAGALQLPELSLPLDPWLLGYWLGNGSKGSGTLTAGSKDGDFDGDHVASALGAAGFGYTRRDFFDRGSSRINVQGLHGVLKVLGVLHDKHVPAAYFRAGEAHRLALLRGLMDSDGFCAESSKVEFCSTTRALAEAVMELVRGLSERPTLAEGRASLYGRDMGPKWRVTWRPSVHNPFALPRKAAGVRPTGSQGIRLRQRMIVDIAPIDSKLMRCITVDSPNAMYLAGEALIPTHNTRVGSETCREWAAEGARHIAVIARASRELRDICFAGPAGLCTVIPPEEIADSWMGLGDTRLILKNGTTFRGFSAMEPDKLRGYAFDKIWADEFASWSSRTGQDAYEIAQTRLRESRNPQIVVTTTPRRTPHFVSLVEEAKTDPSVVISRWHTLANRRNLSETWIARITARLEGTRLGRQELGGELIEDVEGALWTLELIAAALWRGDPQADGRLALPRMRLVVTAVDPSGSPGGDMTGIVTVAADDLQRIFVLEDNSQRGPAEDRYQAVCRAADRHTAGLILYEGAYGGDNVALGIRQAWRHLVQIGELRGACPPVKPSNIPGDKVRRAEPVVALYQQQAGTDRERIYHAADPITGSSMVPELENEMTSWEISLKTSPNLIDSCVHGVRYLLRKMGMEATVETASESKGAVLARPKRLQQSKVRIPR